MRDANVPSWCVRGAQVVCTVPDDWEDIKRYVTDPAGLMVYPVRGETYTIRKVRLAYVPEYMEVLIGLELVEIITPIAEGGSGKGGEIAWDVNAFQPVKHARAEIEQRVEEPA